MIAVLADEASPIQVYNAVRERLDAFEELRNSRPLKGQPNEISIDRQVSMLGRPAYAGGPHLPMLLLEVRARRALVLTNDILQQRRGYDTSDGFDQREALALVLDALGEGVAGLTRYAATHPENLRSLSGVIFDPTTSDWVELARRLRTEHALRAKSEGKKPS